MELHYCYGCMKRVTEEVCPHCGCAGSEENLPHQLPRGTVLNGHYLVGRALGQGGFGITYIGLDRNLDSVVAIKEFFPAAVVNREAAQGLTVRLNAEDSKPHYEASRDRFLREARALAKLREIPQVVSVRELFAENNTAYIVMEYVQGTDLRHMVREKGGKLTPEELFPVLEPLLRALDTVHKSGLVHRDISPDNIMIQPDGTPKLLDFGAVRDVGAADADIDLSHSTEAILKHGFAPMEQYRSRGNLGPWTDEYGICASVYYCLTEQVPPDAPARAMGEEDVDWSTVPGLQDHQRRALDKGMSMRAKDRFGNLEELRRAIFEQSVSEAKMEKQKETTKPTARKKGRGGLIAAALLLVAAAGAGALWFLNRETPEPVTEVVSTETETPETTFAMEDEPTMAEVQETEPTAVDTVAGTVEPYSEPWYNNILMKEPFLHLGIVDFEIKRVSFLDSFETAPKYAVDLSEDGSRSVLGWVDGYDVTIAAEGGINGQECCEGLFEGCRNLESVAFNGAFRTDYATSFDRMFYGCINLSRVDTENLNTGNVISMNRTFAMISGDPDIYFNSSPYRVYVELDKSSEYARLSDRGIESLDLGTWDVSKVTSMEALFAGCYALRKLNVNEWDTSSVNDFGYMFFCCKALKGLDIGDWNVSSATNMNSMFNSSGIVSLDLSKWDTSNVETCSDIFSGCTDLEMIDLENWNFSSSRWIIRMFYGCKNLHTINVSNWYFSDATGLSQTFMGLNSLKMIDVSNWDLSSVTDIGALFSGCARLETIDVSNWDVSNVTGMEALFSGCTSLETIDVGNWNVSNAINMANMFNGCESLNYIDVTEWDVSNVTSVYGMFYGCDNLSVPDISNWDVSNVTEFKNFMDMGVTIDGKLWQDYFKE